MARTSPKQSREEYSNNYWRIICILYQCGHPNALEYGYSYAIKAYNFYVEEQHLNERRMAFAVRLGQAADKKAWEKYCKAPPVGIIPLVTYKGPKKEKPKELTNEQARQIQKQMSQKR